MSSERKVDRVPHLVATLYEVVEQLEALFPGRSFTPDGHLVGSLGECLAADTFGLTLNAASTEGYDAVASDGRRVEIKATQRSSVALSVVDKVLAEILLVLQLHPDGTFAVVYNGPAQPAWDAAGKPQKNGQRRISLATLRRLDASLEPVERIAARPEDGT